MFSTAFSICQVSFCVLHLVLGPPKIKRNWNNGREIQPQLEDWEQNLMSRECLNTLNLEKRRMKEDLTAFFGDLRMSPSKDVTQRMGG